MGGNSSVSVIAGGNITPSRFVKMLTTADRQVVQATAGDRIFGVSKEWTRLPPWENLNDGFIAVLNESCPCYVLGVDSEAYVQAGGAITVGDYLKSDGSGKAVTASADGDEIGGLALEAATTDQIIKITLLRGMRGA